MIKQINWYDFSDWFLKSDTYKNNFSYDGLRALYDYLEDYEEQSGEALEFDPIALCCDYSEFDSLEEIQSQYPDIKSLDDLEDKASVINCDNGHLIIFNF
jgi:hypothetical protein